MAATSRMSKMPLYVPQFLLLFAFLFYWVGKECGATPLNNFESRESSKTCGYQACPKLSQHKLNIHLIPHTHDDVGWLKTVDQYYWGGRPLIAKAGVQYILDSVIHELLEDPNRRFIYVETAYLWKWWSYQNDRVKTDVRRLIDEGRLEIISGAWSMNDEAVTHYQSIIDQFTWGFRRLNDTFGSCARPHVGWQIDPFGHSREQASLFAQMGFDGLFFGRLDYQDKRNRMDKKTAEMIWKGSDSLGKKADLFTSVLFNTYSPPPGFCFDILCADEPIVDDPESPDYNVDRRVAQLLVFAETQQSFYRTNNIIMTMGDDFNYQSAELWFKNLDKLIRYTNDRHGSTVNVFYSTPSCYLKAVNELALSWPTKSDDFFPYASDPHTYWSGYYSSRPTIKFYERMGNNYLQISKQLSALTNISSSETYLNPFREAMGVLQHHDAITGTEKQQVAEDYARILSKAMKGGERILSDALGNLISKRNQSRSREGAEVHFYTCYQLNISSCPYTEENENFVLTLYNPQSRVVSSFVRIPVTGNSYVVRDFTGANLATQIIPIPPEVLAIPGRESSAVNELVFRAKNIQALGYQAYYVTRGNKTVEPVRSESLSEATIQNEFFNVSMTDDGSTCALRKIKSGVTNMRITQSFHYYESSQGNNEEFVTRSSGAYIFRPKDATPKNLTNVGSNQTYKGPLVQEIHVKINEWVSQIVRLYTGEDYIEYDWLVGPIPVDDKVGKEIITSYTSNLATENVFYTDSNGREMLRREKNFRPTWTLQLAEPVAGNYYPITAKVTIKDRINKLRMSVLNDRAQGGSSLNDGQVELMLHRRILHDDAFGVGEALNEIAYGKGLVVRGRHQIITGTNSVRSSTILMEKQMAWNLLNPPCILISPAAGRTFEEWRHHYRMQGSGLTKQLPPNVRILSLEPWKDGGLLFRLEHMFEIGEDTRYSHPVEINIKDLFLPFTVKNARETTLGGNQWLNESERLRWVSDSNEVHRERENVRDADAGSIHVSDEAINILLHPMEIRTFVIEI
ncbi:lysosomal alpha-mannosidase isoform X2 [Diprion similis]|uniref:lysosomal alpha-mannosidase isoform X2 n=1 Tax=Diprion similis TaxID=362088 RepID=UPI001EF7F09D|nr:lysosomal alpha-mannosidase isoform X2 [Diprion similis]